jgi:hypothetical protein
MQLQNEGMKLFAEALTRGKPVEDNLIVLSTVYSTKVLHISPLSLTTPL